MAKALDPIVPFWWTPDSEKDNPTPTSWKIRPLNGIQKIEVNTELKMGPLGLIISAAGVRTVLRHGLLGWKNFADSTGPVEFDEKNMEANIARLSDEDAIAICNRIMDASEVGAEEKKD